jgi:hypothetical protein
VEVEKVEKKIQPKTIVAKLKTSESKKPANKTSDAEKKVVIKSPNSTSTS